MIQRDFKLGDRIFASLTLNGRKIAEVKGIAHYDAQSLLTELRRQSRLSRGLAKLSVRNYTRGWTEEKTLLLRPGIAC